MIFLINKILWKNFFQGSSNTYVLTRSYGEFLYIYVIISFLVSCLTEFDKRPWNLRSEKVWSLLNMNNWKNQKKQYLRPVNIRYRKPFSLWKAFWSFEKKRALNHLYLSFYTGKHLQEHDCSFMMRVRSTGTW